MKKLFINIAIAIFLLTTVEAHAVNLSLGDTVFSGDYTITGVDIPVGSLSLFELLSMSDNGPASTSGLTTGDIWTQLDNAGVSQAWGLEFALNANQTGASPSLTVESLSLAIGGIVDPFTLGAGDSVTVAFDNGASDVEALFRVGFGFDFFSQYGPTSTETFTLSALHSGANDGSDVYSLNSVTITPEPLAMTLFFIGGAPIAASLYRKRKKRAIAI